MHICTLVSLMPSSLHDTYINVFFDIHFLSCDRIMNSYLKKK